MSAPIGNDFAKGHGRPRSAKAQIRRLVQAAQQHAVTAEAIADALRAGRKPACPSELVAGLDPERADLDEQVSRRMVEFAKRQLEHLVGTPVAQLLTDVEAGSFVAAVRAQADAEQRARPEVQLGRDAWADKIANAALALDRLVGEEDQN